MSAVKHGMDRQEAHERLRVDPTRGREVAKELGLTDQEIDAGFSINTGRATSQVLEFLDSINE